MFFKPSSVIIAIAAAGCISATPTKTPRGFVTTNGPKFQLDGDDFYFAGSNAYYLPFTNARAPSCLRAAKAAGLKVFRTWGFYDKNATFDPNGLPQYDGEGAGVSEVYFQKWTNGVPEINFGPNGLQAFDETVKVAEKVGIKLVVPLTNNWADYGGMDVYTVNLGGQYHDDFYHVPKIVDAFKNYVKTFVSRYRSSPAIMAWQLGNEPRCGADDVRNLPGSPACNATMMTNWVKDLSSFIKNIDPHHLVTIGGEGEFNFPGNPDWAYSSGNGGDFYEELQVDTIDYGTFHLYPDWWSKTAAWGTQWVKDHAEAQEKVGKPVVFEEYGWLTPEARLEYLGKVSNQTRLEVVGEWQETSVKCKLAGDQFWQYGFNYSFGRNDNDGFTIYLDDPEAKELIYKHAKRVGELNN
ncbi:glycoside hydrolase [Choiromyces venosus 120613-1]|uniref:mannan endo-1,4-beta-mannosidase n=1 Tax=Choiromyces venosus 120613-1 TaxID=1336337 RepID=A0A3N4IUD2_9PEZI|nr:glycoside hydrolase [Choiromyces venosus 120613-1]